MECSIPKTLPKLKGVVECQQRWETGHHRPRREKVKKKAQNRLQALPLHFRSHVNGARFHGCTVPATPPVAATPTLPTREDRAGVTLM